MMKGKKWIWSLLVLIGLVCPRVAQSKSDEEKPAYEVSFVVVGARSDAYWVGDGPDMKVFAHDPGAAPPRDIFIATGKKQSGVASGEEKRKRLMLALNVPTERVQLRTSKCDLSARLQSGEDISYKKYTSAQLPPVIGEYTVFMARQPKHKTWKEPQRLILSDSEARFPKGAVRVVNLADRPVYIQKGKKVLGHLAPRKSVVIKKALNAKQPEVISLWYTHKGRKVPAFRRALNYQDDQRLNIACTYVPKRSRPLLSQLFLTAKPLPKPEVPKKKSDTLQASSS
ncbi:hypothetical protein HW115_13200 [Verrucomicrobiaceae bacterium N1E253]|uniref:DUF3108 domain-containing protein n=1 Tax=Oceaniferula marina TaxID=2748318 RepID=A0A851GI37_9BACT|nr:hypothetical protein [Oceaniferula marina]NWK56572.1 hypothetical protein [Oceaniferula marina]